MRWQCAFIPASKLHNRVGPWLLLLLLSAPSTVMMTGCALYPDKQPPTLETTTSAEQVQRILWQDVAEAKWVRANALLAPKVVWRIGNRVIPREQIIPWLQAAGITAAQVNQVELQPAVNDVNLVYTLQVQAAHSLAGGPDCAGQPQTWSALAVWQQPQPSATPAPKHDTQYRGYLLTVLDLTPAENSACH